MSFGLLTPIRLHVTFSALRETRVVILTGEVRPAGVDGYRILKKPVDVAVLFAALDDAVATPVTRPASEETLAPPVAAAESVALTLRLPLAPAAVPAAHTGEPLPAIRAR